MTPGQSATVQMVVSPAETAKAVGSGNLEVLATPAMIALMERAACAALAPTLEPSQTSVGTHVQVDHMAASPLGTPISATATVTAVDGRRVVFDVSASQPSGLIGRGTHHRVLVSAARFMAKL